MSNQAKERVVGAFSLPILVAFLTLILYGAGAAAEALRRDNLQRLYESNRGSAAWQQARITEVRSYVDGYYSTTNDAQRAQLRSSFCSVYQVIDNPPADLVRVHAGLC